MLAFTVPERTGERTRYWNRKVTHEHIPLSDSSWGVDAVFDAGQTHWMVLANKQMLQHQLCEEQFDQLHAAAAGRFLCITPAQSDALTNWLSRLVTGRPAQHRALHTVGPGHAIEQAFAIKLADLLWGNSQARPRPAAGTRARGLKRALDRLRSAPLDSVNFPELCESAGVSRRTLEYAFRDQLGMSPQQFLRLRRLHRVRRELMWASEASTTVTQLAHAHGFVDLGRFAGAYFSRFGERPSQTLRGSPPERMLPAHHLLWNSPG